MNKASRGPWYRLHLISLGVGALVAGSFFVLNRFERPGVFDRTWESGWPLRSFERDERYMASFVPELNIFSVSGSARDIASFQLTVRNKGITFRRDLLALNVALTILVVVGSAFFMERRSRQVTGARRFGLASLFSATASIATLIAIVRAWDHPWEVVGANIAFGVAVAGVVVTWFAVFDVLGIVWDRLTLRRGASDAPDADAAPPVTKPL